MQDSIGVFDSGVGGLTVVKEIIRALPDQSLVFLGDTARVPYGTRGSKVITRFALELADYLLQRRVGYLVAACNTISSTCLDAIAQAVPVPVLGVVDPAVREAVSRTRNGRIGVIGTRATVASGVYEQRIARLDAGLRVFAQACPLFVPLAEEGLTHGEPTRLIARQYLHSLREQDIDVLILGCTHYPLLRGVIQECMGDGVILIDSAVPTAQDLRAALQESGLEAERSGQPSYEFLVTDAPERVSEVARSFFEGELPAPLRLVNLG